MGDIQVDSASAGNIYKPKQETAAPLQKPLLDSIYTVAKDARASRLVMPDSPSIYRASHPDEKQPCQTYRTDVTTCFYDKDGRRVVGDNDDGIVVPHGMVITTDATSATQKTHKSKGKK